MKKIIAKQGESRFLISCGDGFYGRTLDLSTGELYQPLPILSILARGYWHECERDIDFNELILSLSCPACGSSILEDIWEVLNEDQNGNFCVDPFPALVCSNECGYYIRLD